MAVFISLITVALIGLVILQSVLLKTALKSEEETFRTDVITALNRVTDELSSDEARHAILQIEIDDSLLSGEKKSINTEIVYSGKKPDSIDVVGFLEKQGGQKTFKPGRVIGKAHRTDSIHDTTIYIVKH